jgi:hypothetical protein
MSKIEWPNLKTQVEPAKKGSDREIGSDEDYSYRYPEVTIFKN